MSKRLLSCLLPLAAVGFGAMLPAKGLAQSLSVVVIGDSNIAGKGVSTSQAYPAHLERILRSRGLNVTVKNAGINGDTTRGVLGRLDSDVPNGTTVAIVSVGINDYVFNGMTLAQIEANQKEIARRLRSRCINVIVMKSGMKFHGAIAKDPKYHVEPPPPGGNYNPKNWHLNSEGYAYIARQTAPQVIAALKKKAC